MRIGEFYIVVLLVELDLVQELSNQSFSFFVLLGEKNVDNVEIGTDRLMIIISEQVLILLRVTSSLS